MKVQECRAARLLQQQNRIKAGRTLTKSKKLVDVGDMKSAASGQWIFSIEEKIEEVITTFKQRWCASDDEQDYNTCCDFLQDHDEVMLWPVMGAWMSQKYVSFQLFPTVFSCLCPGLSLIRIGEKQQTLKATTRIKTGK